MQVQVHADDSIQGGESLAQWAQEEINAKLARLKDYVVRVEVFLTGVDALKTSGAPGKRCVLETRANGRPPIAVNAEAEKVKDAFNAAIAWDYGFAASSRPAAYSSSAGSASVAGPPAILEDTNSLWIENSPMPVNTPG